MSVAIQHRVWTYSKQSGGALVLLLAIADSSHDDGVAYPSLEELAGKARMSERNARYCLRALEQAGEVEVQPQAGPKGCHLYRVLVGADEKIAPGKDCPPAKIARGAKRDTAGRGGGQPAAPEPSSSKPSSSSSPPLPPHVERFDAAMRGVAGYVPESVFLRKVADKYGGLDLEEEALKIAAWLGDHRQRHYTAGFCLNWLSKALTSPPPPTPIRPRTPNGRDNGFGDMSDAEIEARYAHLVVNA